jgi:hypothetical protein
MARIQGDREIGRRRLRSRSDDVHRGVHSRSERPGGGKGVGTVGKPGKHAISRAGRKAMAESGRRNLTAFLDAQAKAEGLPSDAADSYRRDLLAALGPNPSPARLGLAEAAVANYLGILVVTKQLRKRRVPQVATLTERLSWLTSSLSRCLKQLDLGAKPRPRCLADIPEPTVPEAAAKGSI